MRILVDLDEVLVDFIGGACRAWGVEPSLVRKHWPIGEWDIVPPLAVALNRPEPMSQSEFWEQLEGKEEFWTGLRAHSWLGELLALVSMTTDDWFIVSSPSLCPSSHSGKVRWLKDFFGRKFTRFILTNHKEILAGSQVILIDDSDRNIEKFVDNGGRGIIFPAHHNTKYAFANDPLHYVKEQLRCILK